MIVNNDDANNYHAYIISVSLWRIIFILSNVFGVSIVISSKYNMLRLSHEGCIMRNQT